MRTFIFSLAGDLCLVASGMASSEQWSVSGRQPRAASNSCIWNEWTSWSSCAKRGKPLQCTPGKRLETKKYTNSPQRTISLG